MDQEVAISKDEIEQLCAATPFMAEFQIEVIELERGIAEIEVPFQKQFTRPGGMVFGPVFMTAADAAAWFALMTYVGQEPLMITSELNTAFLKPAVEEPIRCRAEVLKFGKRLVYVTAACKNLRDEILCHHTVTYFRASN